MLELVTRLDELNGRASIASEKRKERLGQEEGSFLKSPSLP